MRDYLLADDLSGALDAAAAFHRAGRRVRVVWSHEAWDAAAPDTFIAYTTETRNADRGLHEPAHQARRAVGTDDEIRAQKISTERTGAPPIKRRDGVSALNDDAHTDRALLKCPGKGLTPEADVGMPCDGDRRAARRQDLQRGPRHEVRQKPGVNGRLRRLQQRKGVL